MLVSHVAVRVILPNISILSFWSRRYRTVLTFVFLSLAILTQWHQHCWKFLYNFSDLTIVRRWVYSDNSATTEEE